MPTPLETLVGVNFQNPQLLRSAFVHRSFLHEHPERFPELSTNERLEFLGDAVLNFLTASWLFAHFPKKSEGDLTSLRAALVKTATLAAFARELDLGKHVLISRGEDTPTARNRPALLADVFEAVLGAIYIDRGLEAARAFIEPYLERQTAAIEAGLVARVDYRTRLQEQVQASFNQTPVYYTVDVTGPDHERTFTLEVRIGGTRLGTGSGPSKQAAAQAAAQQALAALEQSADQQPNMKP
jgi:ribonuclease III